MFLKQKNFQKISLINNHQVLNSILIVRNGNEQRSSNKEVVVPSNAKILYQGKKYVISNESFWLTFLKHRHKKLSFCNLVLDKQGWNYVAQQIYCFKLYTSNLTSIYLFEFNNNSSRIKCEICLKLTIETSDVVLVSLLLTLNIVDSFFCWVSM